MAVRARAVPADVLKVFEGAVTQRPGEAVLVIGTQLDRAAYLAVNKVLGAIGGKWDRALKGHVFPADTPETLAEKLDGLLSTGVVVRLADLGFFPTPADLADEVVRLAAIDPGMLVLEPSAGTGALARPAAARAGKVNVFCVEVQKSLADGLHDAGYQVACGDFTKRVPGGPGVDFWPDYFDRVVMNPPFAAQADVDHVLHAWEFLQPGGRLVAVTSTGWTFRSNKKSAAFREFVDAHGAHGTWSENPPESFRSSGTAVRTATLVLDKPE
jgi:predicted RNA methylase